VDPSDQIAVGLVHEKRGALDEALACYRAVAAESTDPERLSEALRRQANVYRQRSEWETATELCHRAGQVALDAGLVDQYAQCLLSEGAIQQMRGDRDAAAALHLRVLDTSSDPRIRGWALQNLGTMAALRGEWDQARSLFKQSQQSFVNAGDFWGQAVAMNNYGRAALEHGNYRMAVELLGEALRAAKRVNDRDTVAVATSNRAEAYAGLGDLTRARAEALDAFEFFAHVRNTTRQVETLRLLGDIELKLGDLTNARRCHRDALALAEEIGNEREIARLKERLGKEDPEA
jgi:tetratricopeptide (TPR) repeat protein